MAKTKEEITEILYEAVAKAVRCDASTLTLDTRWVEDLDFKSVQGMKVCGLLNYRLGTTVPLGRLVECSTLGETVDMLNAEFNK